MTRCKYCGGPVEWKNRSGHFRDFCEACANDVREYDPRTRFDPDGDPADPDRPWRADE